MLDHVDDAGRGQLCPAPDEPAGPAIGDWYELCAYIDGEHREVELTEVQHALVVSLLGLDGPEPRSDEELASTVLPAILDALRNAAAAPESEAAGR